MAAAAPAAPAAAAAAAAPAAAQGGGGDWAEDEMLRQVLAASMSDVGGGSSAGVEGLLRGVGLSHLIRAGPSDTAQRALLPVGGEGAKLEGKVIALYFSAHWCPPCRAFTPTLGQTYDMVTTGPAAREFELIFVSGDRSPAEYEDYLSHMTGWLATPFQSPAADQLRAKFGVRGIPSLVFLNADGTELSRNGRQIVAQDPMLHSIDMQPKASQAGGVATGVGGAALTSALQSMVQRAGISAAKAAAGAVQRYLSNAEQHPSEQKYRRIKRANGFFVSKVSNTPGHEELMKAAGFELEADGIAYVLLPAVADVTGNEVLGSSLRSIEKFIQ
jgi:thiol-disulfide isomerase/thioredoxin